MTERSRGRVDTGDRNVEYYLLLACALKPVGLDLSRELILPRSVQLSWDRLLASATANKMRPELALHLEVFRHALDPGGRASAESAEFARALEGRGLFMAGELVRVLDALRAQGVLAVPYKGPVFASLLGSGPELREMSDLDLLVQPGDVIRAAMALLPLGYQSALPSAAMDSPWLARVTSELPFRGRNDAMLLEVHWALSPPWFASPCTVDDVMGRLTQREFFGSQVRWPAAEELLLIHLADGMKSGGCGIRWVADAVKILRRYPDLDWAHVSRVAVRNGGLNGVCVALALIDELARDTALLMDAPSLAVDLPEPARALAGVAERRPRLAEAVRLIRHRLQTDANLTDAKSHFLWALRIADHPTQVGRKVLRYLWGPNVTDLCTLPAGGESDLALRMRALRRRLGKWTT